MPGQVDAGDQRVGAGDAAVLAGGQAVLEVHAGPLDPDRHLARRQVRRGQLAETAREGAALGRSTTKARKEAGRSDMCG